MRLEEVTSTAVHDAPDRELYSMRLRFIQLYPKFKTPSVEQVGELTRQDFLNKYILLRREMVRRALTITTNSVLDFEVMKFIVAKSAWGLDVPRLGEVVIVESFISLGGSYVKAPKSAQDLDVIIRAPESERDEGTELKVGRLLRHETGKEPHFVYAPRGPHSSFLPLFDLVLRPKTETKAVDVDEVGIHKDLSQAQRAECDAETERIRENKKTPEAQRPHKFKPAKWTHPNGHPRCLICGDEETIGGICGKEPTKEQVETFIDDLKKMTSADYKTMEDSPEMQAAAKAATDALVTGSVLDLGCGAGGFLKSLSQHPERRGVEVDPVGLEISRGRGLAVDNHDLKAFPLPYEDLSWDNVTAIHVAEHLPDLPALAKEMERLAVKKTVIIAPLGDRGCIEHVQSFNSVEAVKKLLPAWNVEKIGFQVLATWERTPTVEKAGLTPFGRFTPPKPTMAGLTEAFSVDQIKNWLEGKYPLDVEEKLNGFRFILEKKGNKVRLKTEGNVDRTKQLPDVTAALAKITQDFILDCSTGIEHNGRALPRIRLMTLMADKPELGEGDVVKVTIFDMPYLGEDLHERPLTERRAALEKFFAKYLKGDPHFGLTSYNIVSNEAALVSAFKRLGRLPQSEGVVIKTLKGGWDTDGSTSEWAKIKHELEVKAIVLDRKQVTGGNWSYTGGLLPGGNQVYTNLTEYAGKKYVNLGNTFNSKLEAQVGDIITCGVEEIIPQGPKLVWLGARVIDIDKDRSAPYFANQVVIIAEEANLLQKTKLPGLYLVVPHGQMIADGDKTVIIKKRPIPKGYLARDLFLVEDKHVLGTLKLQEPKLITQKQFTALAPKHKISDTEAENWGFDKAKVLYAYDVQGLNVFKKPIGYDPPPGIQTVIREVDVVKARQEFGNIEFKEGDSGTVVAQFHIMGLSEEQAKKLTAIRSEVVSARSDLGKLQTLLKNAIGEHGCHVDLRFRPAGKDYWEGGEVFIGNFAGMDKLPELFAGKRVLRAPWKQPRAGEVQAETVRGPLEWMNAGANGPEMFEPGSPGATAKEWGAMIRFDKFNWDVYSVSGGTEKEPHAFKFHFDDGQFFQGNFLWAWVPVAEGSRVWMIRKLPDADNQKPEVTKFEFHFLKLDKKQHVVGGVVYEPDTVDTQGDYTVTPEIEKAMYLFMMKYSQDTHRIKVMHRGVAYFFPILECFQPEQDTRKGNQTIKAGSWWMTIKVTNDEVWTLVEEGALTGFSMGGRAHS